MYLRPLREKERESVTYTHHVEEQAGRSITSHKEKESTFDSLYFVALSIKLRDETRRRGKKGHRVVRLYLEPSIEELPGPLNRVLYLIRKVFERAERHLLLWGIAT